MDLAMELAVEVDADIVVANDPDADRCAVAVPGGRTAGRCCSGDEVGALLAHHLLELRREGVYATSIVSSSLLGKMARRREAAVRRDAHRLQVDRPRREPRLRLRGGARLLRRPGPREGQGRRLRAADGLRHRRPGEGSADAPCATCSTTSPATLRPARDRPALGADGRPRGDPGRGRPAARPPADLARRLAVERRRRPLRGLGGPAADHRPALPAGRRRPGRRTPVGHRAEDQVLPRGRRPGGATTTEDGVDAARISAVGRLDAIRGDLQAAAGL